MADPDGARPTRRRACPLDAELRVALGVDLEERVSLRARGTRTILLERRRSGDVELPADRDLVLCVDVRVVSADRCIRLDPGGRQIGPAAASAHDDHAKSVWLHRGEVVVRRLESAHRSARPLVGARGHDHARTAARRRARLRRGERFGKALVERGLLTPRELWSGLQRQVEEIVRSLFSYRPVSSTSGTARCSPTTSCASQLSTQRLVEEGARWRDELARFVARARDPRVRIEASRDAPRLTSGDRTTARRRARRGVGVRARSAAASDSTSRPPRACSSSCTAPARCASAAPRGSRSHAARETRRDRRATARRRRRTRRSCSPRWSRRSSRSRARPRRASASRQAIEDVATRVPGFLGGVVPAPALTLDPEQLVARASAIRPSPRPRRRTTRSPRCRLPRVRAQEPPEASRPTPCSSRRAAARRCRLRSARRRGGPDRQTRHRAPEAHADTPARPVGRSGSRSRERAAARRPPDPRGAASPAARRLDRLLVRAAERAPRPELVELIELARRARAAGRGARAERFDRLRAAGSTASRSGCSQPVRSRILDLAELATAHREDGWLVALDGIEDPQQSRRDAAGRRSGGRARARSCRSAAWPR